MPVYTVAQLGAAKESWEFWVGKGATDYQAAALLGNEEGETSFDWAAVGDRGEAHGIFQWHAPRADAMMKGCGIDVRAAGHLAQLNAAYYEMTNGVYRRVWPALTETLTLQDAVTVLVHQYEGSAQQARDVARRTVEGNYWLIYGRKNWSTDDQVAV